jgi:hypothetical protein
MQIYLMHAFHNHARIHLSMTLHNAWCCTLAIPYLGVKTLISDMYDPLSSIP